MPEATAHPSVPDRPTVVVVTPVFNEEAGLAAYREAVEKVLLSRDDADYRVLFVDDGSSDGSWRLIEEICAADSRFQALRLSRNFGAHTALTAGINEADGDAVVTLAADLQDPPEVVLEMVERWRAGAKIVWGKRKARRDAIWRMAASRLFFRLVRTHAMPRASRFTTGSFLLVDRTVAECFREFREHNRITFALVAWTGFDQDVVEYERRARVLGTSAWTFTSMLETAWDAFVSFSSLPFRLMTWAGVGLFLASMLFAVYLVATWLLGDPKPGWTSTSLLISVLFGIQFLMMGVLGQYLSRIHTESVRRPLYFVSDRAGDPERPG